MGFLEFVKQRKAMGDKFLFPSLKENRLGSKADAIGKWFARLRKEVVADLPDVHGAKGLHSLRHSFARACRDARIPLQETWAIGGWTQGQQRNSESEYGSGFSLKRLKESIDLVKYPELDLSPLYPKGVK